MITISDSLRAVIVSVAGLASMVLAMLELESQHVLSAATHAFGSLSLGLLAIDGAGTQRAPWLRIITMLAAIIFVGFVAMRIWRGL